MIRKGRGGIPRVRMPGLVTQSELAKAIGITPTTLIRAVDLGRVKPAAVDAEDRLWFDEAQAVAAYNGSMRRKVQSKEPPPPVEQPESEGSPGAESYNEARRRLAIADANKREIEVHERKGALVSRESVTRALVSAGTALKDRLSGLGARLAAGLAAETDPRRIKEQLDDAIREALFALRRDLDTTIPAVKDDKP